MALKTLLHPLAQHSQPTRRACSGVTRPKTILIFDGDTAGATAAMRGIGSLFEVGLEVRVVTLPEDHDPRQLRTRPWTRWPFAPHRKRLTPLSTFSWNNLSNATTFQP